MAEGGLAGIRSSLRKRVADVGLARGTATDALITAVTRAFIFVIIPLVLLVLFKSWAQNNHNDLLFSGLNEMQTMVLIFGSMLVVISFLWAYHLRSTKARLIFGLIGAGLLILYGYAVLLTGGFSDALKAMSWVLPPESVFGVVCYIAIGNALKFVRDYGFFRTTLLKSETKETPFKPQLGVGEFDRRLGSLSSAASSAGKFVSKTVVRWSVVFLLFIWVLSFFGFGLSASETVYLNTLANIVTIILLLGIPLTALAWFKGYYPKGTISKGLFDIVLSLGLVLLIFLVFASSGLPQIARQGGADFPIFPIGLALVAWAVIDVLRAIGELRDERRPWKLKLGYEVKSKKRFWQIPPESTFYDFSPEIGKFSRGLVSAKRTFFWFVVLPEILLLVGIGTARAAGSDTGPLFTALTNVAYILPILGLILALISFARGYYPAGSFGRMFIGLLLVPGLFLYAFNTFITPAVENAFRAKGIIIPFELIVTLIIVSVLFVGFTQFTELIDSRKAWKISVGKKTKPLKPIKKMTRLQEFRYRFGSAYEANRWARKGMVRYLYYTTIMLIVLLTVIESLSFSVAGVDLTSLDATLRSVYLIIIIIAIPLAAVRSIYGFYTSGSTPRLVFGLIMCLVGATYTYWALKGGNIVRSGDFGSVQAGLSIDFSFIVYAFLIGWVLFAITITLDYLSYRKEYVKNDYRPVASAEVQALKKQEKLLQKEERRAKKAAKEGISVSEVEDEEAPDAEGEVEEEIRKEIGEDAMEAHKGASKRGSASDQSPPPAA